MSLCAKNCKTLPRLPVRERPLKEGSNWFLLAARLVVGENDESKPIREAGRNDNTELASIVQTLWPRTLRSGNLINFPALECRYFLLFFALIY